MRPLLVPSCHPDLRPLGMPKRTLAARMLVALVFLCGIARAGNAVSFQAVVPVSAGDVIDFAVGFGPNGHFSNDTTGLAAAIALGAVQFDVAADFSATDNPNGVWQYGWSLTLGAPIVLSTHPAVRDGIDSWRGDLAPDGNPGEYHNGTTGVLVIGNTAPMDPGQFAFHPGPGGEYAVVRFVAPEAGDASIDAVFTGLDLFGTTTDVHVLLNGTALFDGFVGPIPEPATLLLLGLGLGALGASGGPQRRSHGGPRTASRTIGTP